MPCGFICKACLEDAHQSCTTCFPEESDEEYCFKCKDVLCAEVGVVFCTKDGEEETMCDPCWFNDEKKLRKEGWKPRDDEDYESEEDELKHTREALLKQGITMVEMPDGNWELRMER